MKRYKMKKETKKKLLARYIILLIALTILINFIEISSSLVPPSSHRVFAGNSHTSDGIVVNDFAGTLIPIPFTSRFIPGMVRSYGSITFLYNEEAGVYGIQKGNEIIEFANKNINDIAKLDTYKSSSPNIQTTIDRMFRERPKLEKIDREWLINELGKSSVIKNRNNHLFNSDDDNLGLEIDDFDTEQTSLSSGDEQTTTSSTPQTKPAGQICNQFSEGDLKDVTVQGKTITSSIESINEDKPDSKEDFLKQWCKFYQTKDKKELWNKLTPNQREALLKEAGNQYGANINIKGLGKATWDDNNLIINGNRINLDLERYYSEANNKRDFSFRERNDWKYTRQPIREISIEEDGSIKIELGGLGEGNKGESSINLKGEDISFDPNTMEISANDKKYSWNGRGKLDFDSKEGKLKMNFLEGINDNDVTNFPIIRLPDNSEVSPFQEAVDKKFDEIEKPSSGYKILEGGRYTIDSKGVVREIKSSELSIDKTTGEVKTIKNTYINNNKLKGDLFASGEFGIGKDSGVSNYFDLTDDILTIINEGSNTLHYTMNSDLKKLDIKGSGTTNIKNGDQILQFSGDKLSYKKLPSEYQNFGGELKHTIEEIVNVKDGNNPYKITKDKNNNLALMDSSGEKPPEGEIDLRTPEEKEQEEKEQEEEVEEEENEEKEEQTKKGKPPTIRTETYVDALAGTDGISNRDLFQIGSNTWNKLLNNKEKLSKKEFLNKLIQEGKFRYSATFVTTYFGPPLLGKDTTLSKVKETIRGGPEVNRIISQFGHDDMKLNPGDKISIDYNSGSTKVSFRGQTITASTDAQKKEITNLLARTLSQPPRPPTDPQATITISGNKRPPLDVIYEVYEKQYGK
jgi:hypothetical protein